MQEDLIWLAGIWDGEGSVFMTYQEKRNMTPHISMDNTDPNIISEAFKIFKDMGINIHVNETLNKKGSTRPVYRLATAKLQHIKIFAEKVGPYIRGEKKAKLELLYNFVCSRIERGKRAKYSEDETFVFNEFRSSQTTRETPKGDDIVGRI